MPENNQQVIRIENVKKRYEGGTKGFWALKGIDLQVVRGEFIAVIGKSGSGKSTLLNLLGGIDRPTEGRIHLGEQRIDQLSENQLCRLRGETIGFVFQFFQLMPTLTVIENVIMPMDYARRIPAARRKERAEMLLAKVGLTSHSSKFPAALSGGEQQRVAIARALANNPPIILADEPTGNLDSQTAEDVFALLQSLTGESKNVIMATHNEELAERCHRIIRIKDGIIVGDSCTDTANGVRLRKRGASL